MAWPSRRPVGVLPEQPHRRLVLRLHLCTPGGAGDRMSCTMSYYLRYTLPSTPQPRSRVHPGWPRCNGIRRCGGRWMVAYGGGVCCPAACDAPTPPPPRHAPLVWATPWCHAQTNDKACRRKRDNDTMPRLRRGEVSTEGKWGGVSDQNYAAARGRCLTLLSSTVYCIESDIV